MINNFKARSLPSLAPVRLVLSKTFKKFFGILELIALSKYIFVSFVDQVWSVWNKDTSFGTPRPSFLQSGFLFYHKSQLCGRFKVRISSSFCSSAEKLREGDELREGLEVGSCCVCCEHTTRTVAWWLG
jgi:hypothetical protein